jgi:hypothetical protein
MDDSSLTISVSEVGRTSNDDEQYHGESVLIPRQAVSSIERRHLNVARSLLVAGAMLGGAIYVGSQGLGNGTIGKPKVPTPQQ